MSWKFNPFTGTLDKVNDNEGGSSETISKELSFVIADWILSAGFYILDLQHNLDSLDVNNMIWENSSDQVQVDRVNILNNNNIRLYVAADPDCRFDGKAIIFKVQTT